MYKPAAPQTPDDTAALAAALTPLPQPAPLSAPLRLYLSGDLGAGKTHFARALLNALGERGTIPSPSYALAHSYHIGALTVHHLDCYRLQGSPLGDDLHELLDDNALCLLEWPENAPDIPPSDAHLHFNITGTDARRIQASASSSSGRALLARWP